MNRSVNLVARSLGFAWVGVIAFGIYPPSGHAELLFQAVAYGVTGLGMIGWALLDYAPRAARYRHRGLPVILGVIAAATGGRGRLRHRRRHGHADLRAGGGDAGGRRRWTWCRPSR